MARRTERPRRVRRQALLALSLGGLPWVALAQNWQVDPTVSLRTVAYELKRSDYADGPRRDVLLDLTPSLTVRGRGPRYNFSGSVGAVGLAYLNRTETNRALPRANVDLQTRLIEEVLFLDLSGSALGADTDPFQARTEGDSTYSRQTAFRTRVSPYIDYRPSANLRVIVRNDSNWFRTVDTSSSGATEIRGTSVDNRLSLDRTPRPWGGAFELTTRDSRFAGQANPTYQAEAVRVTGLWSPDPSLVFGPRFGRERVEFSSNQFTDGLTGLSFDWRPGERSSVSGSVEKRFFGWGADIAMRHRSPYMALYGRMLRAPTTIADSLGVIPAGSDVASLLNAMLTTRYPNPVDRAQVVQQLMESRNLPNTLDQPREVFAQGAQLAQNVQATVAFLSAKRALSFTVYTSTSRQLAREGESGVSLSNADTRQFGASVQFDQRLDPDTSIQFVGSSATVSGLGLTDGDVTRQERVRLSLNHQLTSRTAGTLGLRLNRTDSSRDRVPDSRETAVFAGILQRF